jgi:ACS family glucarate transporter-like MFS transporter
LSLVAMPLLIEAIGWRWTFVANAALGFAWAAAWWIWFRDSPRQHAWTNDAERAYIEAGINGAAEDAQPEERVPPFIQLVTSANVLLAMFQYAASNVTFFIAVTWLRPYMEDRWGAEAANLSALPLLGGAVALWLSGWLVTHLYRRGFAVASRRVPAMAGFAIGAAGLLLCARVSEGDSALRFALLFSLALFGVEMILSPSWSFCMDIGGLRSGAVSGSMNMVGNLGAALSAVMFPYFVNHVTIPWFAPRTGSANSFFVFAASMNLLALVCWTMMNPRRRISAHLSPAALRLRLAAFIGILLLVAAAVVYTQIVAK